MVRGVCVCAYGCKAVAVWALIEMLSYPFFAGYVTSSKTKILVVVEDDALPEIQKSTDEEIKRLLVNVHSLYVADLMNPFQEIGSPIVSAKFRAAIQQSVAAFNQSDGL